MSQTRYMPAKQPPVQLMVGPKKQIQRTPSTHCRTPSSKPSLLVYKYKQLLNFRRRKKFRFQKSSLSISFSLLQAFFHSIVSVSSSMAASTSQYYFFPTDLLPQIFTKAKTTTSNSLQLPPVVVPKTQETSIIKVDQLQTTTTIKARTPVVPHHHQHLQSKNRFGLSYLNKQKASMLDLSFFVSVPITGEEDQEEISSSSTI